MKDFFISYRRSNGAYAVLLKKELQKRNIDCFLDIDEFSNGLFNKQIYDDIDNSKSFVIVLSSGDLDRCVNENDWVRKEIEYALEKNKVIVPFMMDNFKFPEKLPESIECLKYINGVNHVIIEYFDAAVMKLVSLVKDTKVINKNLNIIKDRFHNNYLAKQRERELERLRAQSNLLKKNDLPTYLKAFGQFERVDVLDVGCNTGDLIIDRLSESGKEYRLIGIDYDLDTIKIAIEKHPKPNNIFFQADIESKEFYKELKNTMNQLGVKKFNIINLSMILLHLKEPLVLLEELYDFLDEDGLIIIKDIDDGFNLAYPDEDGSFERAINICMLNKSSGYRHSGRQIFTILKQAGYSDISIESLGVNTAKMSPRERNLLFEIYFSFVLGDLKEMVDDNPDNDVYKTEYEWLDANYDILKNRFKSTELFFNLGIMLFLVKK